MDVAPWIRVFGAILDTVPSACYKSFGLRSIKDADVLSENINFSAQLSSGQKIAIFERDDLDPQYFDVDNLYLYSCIWELTTCESNF